MENAERERLLADDRIGLVNTVDGQTDVVVIAFGGMKNSIAGLPPFEFLSMLGDGAATVFVRDLDQVWYHCGVRGLSSNISETAAALRRLIADIGAPRVVTLGTSAGGFGAILFGALIEADSVIAFSPQTFLTHRLRLVHRERRWHRQLRDLHRLTRPADRVLDLRSVLRRGQTPIAVHVGSQERLDGTHARHIASLPCVDLQWHPAGHNVAKHLRDSGQLERVVRDAVGQ